MRDRTGSPRSFAPGVEDGVGAPTRAEDAKGIEMATPNPVAIGPVQIGKDRPLALIAGPCVMEPGDMTLRIAAPAGRALRPSGRSPGLQGLVRQGQPDLRVELPRSGPRGGDEGLRARQGRDRPAGDDRHPRDDPGQADRRGGRPAPDPRLPGAPDRPAGGGGGDRPAGQRQEGAVHGPLGHDERRRQADRPPAPRACS